MKEINEYINPTNSNIYCYKCGLYKVITTNNGKFSINTCSACKYSWMSL